MLKGQITKDPQELEGHISFADADFETGVYRCKDSLEDEYEWIVVFFGSGYFIFHCIGYESNEWHCNSQPTDELFQSRLFKATDLEVKFSNE